MPRSTALRGTIHLERINGLVYAVVMELRGIYMSADWKAAEPFARKLTSGLAELQATARDWKTNAIAAQRSNVEELSKRIDEFVRFRTELVRLGREESTAAARAFGDNDANRNVRTALNDSLSALARAYEQEIGRARSQIHAKDGVAAEHIPSGSMRSTFHVPILAPTCRRTIAAFRSWHTVKPSACFTSNLAAATPAMRHPIRIPSRSNADWV